MNLKAVDSYLLSIMNVIDNMIVANGDAEELESIGSDLLRPLFDKIDYHAEELSGDEKAALRSLLVLCNREIVKKTESLHFKVVHVC